MRSRPQTGIFSSNGLAGAAAKNVVSLGMRESLPCHGLLVIVPSMAMVIWVALGGAIGAGARYLVGVQAVRMLGHGFPWGTLIVNVAGSFAMGILIALFALKIEASQEVRAFLTTGILGGFTTFSAFSLDFAILAERKAMASAGLYALGSVGVSILALFAGLWVIRAVVQ